jgi:rhodanese-related sulfurtransferase
MKDRLTGGEFKRLIYSELSRIGKALGDPKRLEILDLVSQTEKNVEQLAGETGMSLAATSHHLQILKSARLVSDRREGKYVFYSIQEAGLEAWRAISRIGEGGISEIRLAMESFFDREEEIEEILYPELFRKISNNDVVLIDVRSESEYETDHIPGSLSIPLKELEKRIGELPRRKRIVAYCRGRFCVLSKEAVATLRDRGFNAHRLKDGIFELREMGYLSSN